MKVVLLKNIKGTGLLGEIKEVNDGYAFNYLIPNKLARAAQASDLSRKNKRSFVAQKVEKKKSENRRLQGQLTNVKLSFKQKADENGHIFGSVSPKMISEELAKQGVSVDAKLIKTKGLKELGEHRVVVDFGAQGLANLTVNISKE